MHGCFWHRHDCRAGRGVPKIRAAFWDAKLTCNVERDRRSVRALEKAGWKVLVVWECGIMDRKALERRIRKFLK